MIKKDYLGKVNINLNDSCLVDLNHPAFQNQTVAKLNFVLFRGYLLFEKFKEKNLNNISMHSSRDNFNSIFINDYEGKKYVNFPKENYNFFTSLNSGNFRLFKLNRCIKVLIKS